MAYPSIPPALRRETAADHARVDSVFSQYNLANESSYGDFLAAHAAALLPYETALCAAPGLPAWRRRGPLLRDDLVKLGNIVPALLAVVPPANGAQALGMLYVLEGSRLGGSVLIKQVDPTLPRKYLGAHHLQGEWRALLATIRSRLREDADIEKAIVGAKAVFDHFVKAGEAARQKSSLCKTKCPNGEQDSG